MIDHKILPLSRLCGLETEYAMHFKGARPTLANYWADSPSHRAYFDLILDALKIPAAPPKPGKKHGAFLANGCAVWFETQGLSTDCGLLESCTPECQGPKQLAAASRGLEQLLIEASEKLTDQPVKLLKNCIDTRGTHYGAQENYEVIARDPGELDKWQTGIQILMALQLICLGPFIILYLAIVLFSAVLGTPIVLLAEKLNWKKAPKLRKLLLGSVCPLNAEQELEGVKLPLLVEPLFMSCIRICLIPVTVGVSLFYRYRTKVGRTYEKMTPFVASRIIFSGAGGLDSKGRFFLGQKASTRNRDWFHFVPDYGRSIFCFNPIFKALSAAESSNDYDLTKPRQILCLAIGDSNMCQEAEYLKVATTTLVIDAIEAGAITEIPELKNTIKSLHQINNDPSLTATVETERGEMTAIQIQQFYLNACRTWVESLEEPPAEALDVLRRWSEVLFALKNDPEELFGRIDWITKRTIMRHTAGLTQSEYDNSQASRNEFCDHSSILALRKVDVKYHELSSDGYYYQLFNEKQTQPYLNDSLVEKAERMPPLSKPASERCRYIREFAEAIEWCSWDAIKLKDSVEKRFEREVEKVGS